MKKKREKMSAVPSPPPSPSLSIACLARLAARTSSFRPEPDLLHTADACHQVQMQRNDGFDRLEEGAFIEVEKHPQDIQIFTKVIRVSSIKIVGG